MKRETKVRAMERLLAMQSADAAAEAAVENAAAACRGTLEADAVAAAGEAWRASQKADAATEAWKSMAKAQRDYAAAAAATATGLGQAAARLGGIYSGSTDREVIWGDCASARTATSDGDRYSRSCKYSKTDARHEVTISVDGIVDLVDALLLPSRTMLASASAAEGLPLISYHAATGEATWVVSRNKRLATERGWVATDGRFLYHSTESLEHARRGVARKAAAAARAAERELTDLRADRRARLVIRLCKGAQATVADAVAAGYCSAGIRAWQERFGIGDAAPLADLVRTGDPLATRLALDLARKVRREAAAV
jgi:hypothetical protein